MLGATMSRTIAVVGGGAAGFFSALAAKEHAPEVNVILFEKTAQLLSKVKISGGGRCNVTHHCFDPKILVQNYPRGNKELLGPFHRFQPADTIEWFRKRGVILKEESDGRIFPISNCSETIIHCFLQEAHALAINIQKQTKLEKIRKVEEGFILEIQGKDSMFVDRVILATGSASGGWAFAKELGHTIQTPVPSLFTFTIPNFPLKDIAGVSHPKVALKLEESQFQQIGPILITHWGFSGPAVLKLSAVAARYLAEKNYQTSLFVDWAPEFSETQLLHYIEKERQEHPSQQLGNVRIGSISKSLWKGICEKLLLNTQASLCSFAKSNFIQLSHLIKKDRYAISGKTTNKEEFVTCGGVTLSEVCFKTMESKICPHLFFCGEILDIDGVTGGFNFQNAWTTGWLAGRASGSYSRFD